MPKDVLKDVIADPAKLKTLQAADPEDTETLPGSRHDGSLSAADLWQRFGGEIEVFYSQLKTEVAHGWILEPEVAEVRDYQSLTKRAPGGAAAPFDGPKGDMVILELEAEGNFVAIRPSGTEPKVKLYLFAYEPPELIADLELTKAEVAERLDRLQEALAALASVK